MSNFTSPLPSASPTSELLAQTLEIPTLGLTPATPDTTFLQDVLHGIGKVEEVTTKVIGQLLTDDPKYDDVLGSSDYWNQVGFFNLAQDLGVNEDNLGTWGPVLAAVLGLGAAVVNPIDPLNKFRGFAKLTKRGLAGKRLADALEMGKTVDAISKGKLVKLLDIQALGKELKRIDKDISLLSDKKTREAQKALKVLRKERARVDLFRREALEVNKTLRKLYREGLDLDRVMLGKTISERVRRGQQTAISFSNPKVFDQLDFLGVGRNEVKSAAIQPLPPKLRGIDEALLIAGSEVKKAAKHIVGAGARGLQSLFGFKAIQSEKLRNATTIARQIAIAARGEAQFTSTQIEAFIRENQLNPEEAREVIDAIEDLYVEERRTLKSMIDDIQKRGWPQATKVREAPFNRPDLFQPKTTEEQAIQLSPSGLDPTDLEVAQGELAKEARPVVTNSSGHEVVTTPGFVFIRKVPPRDARKLRDAEKIWNLKVWDIVQEEDGSRTLVARRMPDSGPISKRNQFEIEHYRNLGAISAQLSKSGWVISDLRPDDLLITPYGGVQIVNPKVFKKVKNKRPTGKELDEVLTMNRASLTKFADNYTELPKGPYRNLFYLANHRTASQLPKDFKKALSWRVARSEGDPEGLFRGNIHHLIENAVNTEVERAFLSSRRDKISPLELAAALDDPETFLSAQRVEAARASIRAQLSSGKKPVIPPLEVGVDAHGNMWIIKGKDYAVAAALEGLEIVPIKRTNLAGQALSEVRESTYYVGKAHTIAEVFDHLDDRAAKQLQGHLSRFVDQDYKIYTVEDGRLKPIYLPNNKEFYYSNGSGLVRALSKVFRSSSVPMADRMAILSQSLENLRLGTLSDPAVAMTLAKLVHQSNSGVEFVQKLGEFTGLDFRDLLIRPGNLEEAFVEMVEEATKFYDNLSNKGVIFDREIQLEDYKDSLLGSDRVIVALDRPGSVLSIYADKTPFDMKRLAESILESGPPPTQIIPSELIRLHSSGQVDELEVGLLGDYIGSDVTKISAEDLGVTFSDERIDELRQQGVYVLRSSDSSDDLKTTLESLGMRGGVLFGPAKEGFRRMEFKRTISYPFLLTPRGDIIISNRLASVEDLARTIFGDGPRFYSESGLLSRGRIILNHPLGSTISELTRENIDVLQARLETISDIFTKTGLRKRTRIDIEVPFEPYIWRRINPKWRTLTLQDLKEVKLRIPEDLNGTKLDLVLEDVESIVEVRPPRVGGEDSAKQKVFDFVRNLGDEDAYKAFQAGLDARYYSGHFSRIATPEFREALHSLWEEAKKKGPQHTKKSIDTVESIFKKRRLTDFTTTEINRIGEKILSVKDKTGSIEKLLSDIIKWAYKEFGKSLDPDLGRWLLNVTSRMPSGSRYFIESPALMAQIRHAQTLRAIARAEQLEVMAEAGAVWSGTPRQFQIAKARRHTSLRALEVKVRRLENDLDRVTNLIEDNKEIATIMGDPRIAELENTRDAIQEELIKTQGKLMEAEEAFINSNGGVSSLEVDMDSGSVFIAAEDAEDLLNRGVIDPRDIGAGGEISVSDTMVQIPFDKYSDLLHSGEIKIYLFTREAEGVMQNLFRLQTPSNWTNFLTRVWDPIHDIFRSWTLYPIPAYHIRNAFSNTVLAWLGGVTDVADYQDSFRLLKVIRDFKLGNVSYEDAEDMLKAMKFTNRFGNTVTGLDMYSEWVRRGGISGGFFYNEWSQAGKLIRGSDLAKLEHAAGLVPSSMAFGNWALDNPLIRGGITVANLVESPFRMAAFFKGWRESGFEAGDQLMKKVFYDYADLSAFERDVMRRIVPFYSWLRHNIPRMLETMALEPQIHLRLSQFAHRIEQGALDNKPPDKGSLAKWMKDAFGLVVFAKKNQWFVKFGEGLLPFTDVLAMTSGRGIKEMVFGGLTPFLKVPFEILFNQSLFTDSEIDRLAKAGGAEPSRSTALATFGFTRGVSTTGPLGLLNTILNDHLFKSFFRMGKVSVDILDSYLDKRNWIGGSPSMGTIIWALALGKGMVIDPARMKANLRYKWTQRKAAFQRVIDYYESQGLQSIADQVRAMKTYAMLQVGDL